MAGRVFVVGAGASAHDSRLSAEPLPLATEFFKSRYVNRFWPGDLPSFQKSALARTLRQYFGYLTNANMPNVEEVYSFLDVAPTILRAHLHNRKELADARDELLAYVTAVIRDVGAAVTNPEIHSWIAQAIRPQDTILTFNWDLLFDQTLSTHSVGSELLSRYASLLDPVPSQPGGTLDDGESDLAAGYLVKLHGSINLARCANAFCRRHFSPYRFAEASNIVYNLWSCRECGGALEVMLVPPHVHKTYQGNRLLTLFASIAAKRLATAEEIVVVGYSFPAFDFEAQSLFRAARLQPWQAGTVDDLESVVLVDPQTTQKQNPYTRRAFDVLGLNGKRAHGQRVRVRTFASVNEYLADGRPTSLV